MPRLLHRCMTKAINAEGDQRKYGPNWITSRRGLLKVFDDHLECGNWRIDYPEIENAVLYSFRSPFLRIPGYVLTVETVDQTYHFGLNGWGQFWKGTLPFEIKREKGKLAFTWYSLLVRLLSIVWLSYFLWRWIVSWG